MKQNSGYHDSVQLVELFGSSECGKWAEPGGNQLIS